MKTKLTAILSLLAGFALAATITVGPYDVDIDNTDIPRVKDWLTSLPDRQVIENTTNVVDVTPPVATNEWDFVLEPSAVLSNGFVVAVTNISSRWVDDPLMDILEGDSDVQVNQKLKVKLEWKVGQHIQNKMNREEKTYGVEQAVSAVQAEWQASNDVFSVTVGQ